jgi:hypothetical protein
MPADAANSYRKKLELEYAEQIADGTVRILGVIPEDFLAERMRGHGPMARVWFSLRTQKKSREIPLAA